MNFDQRSENGLQNVFFEKLPNYKVRKSCITKLRSSKIAKLRKIITKLRRNDKVAQK